MSLDQETQLSRVSPSQDAVREIQTLTARLRAELGELDDAAIQAVSEATGAPEEYVRLIARSAPENDRRTLLDRARGSFLAFDPDLRRYTMAGVSAAATGLAIALSAVIRDSSGFMGTLALVAIFGSLWNSAVAKNTRVALFSGLAFGSVAFIVMTFFTFIFSLVPSVHVAGPPAGMLVFWIVLSAFGSMIAHSLFASNRAKLGFGDPTKERHELIQQLHEIQSKLNSDEKLVTFLSIDIVGSTQIKSENNPLEVEFTFNEYHRFVQTVVERYGGKVHSTAGDGVTCVFESPQMGYAAGRAILAGLFEFNSFRNKLAKPIDIRSGVHTGSAHIAGQSLTNVNFAHVIDVAAHMQKAGDPGSLVVSETTAQYVPGGLDNVSSERTNVHDFAAAIWRPKSIIPPTVPAQVPTS